MEFVQLQIINSNGPRSGFRALMFALLLSSVVTATDCDECGCYLSPPPLDRFKKSFCQLWETEAAWIGSSSEFQQYEINTLLRTALPLDGTMDNILALQPALRTYHLSGPQVVDVPEQLYDAQLNILWRKNYGKRCQSSVWMQPKIRSDFETSHDAFFFSGGFFIKYGWKPKVFDLYVGALFLDRDDVSFLPGFGLIYTPNHDFRAELLLPRPKISYRVSRNGNSSECWAYLSGQLGGGSFAVVRDSGARDKVTIHDLRLFCGLEKVTPGGGGTFGEIGYTFNRGIEYESSPTEFDFNDSVMFRGGIRF